MVNKKLLRLVEGKHHDRKPPYSRTKDNDMARKKRDQLDPFTVAGRLIGHGSGWDQVDDYEIVIYDFVPLPGIDLPECDLSVSFNNGRFSNFGEDGKLVWQADIIEKLKDVSR